MNAKHLAAELGISLTRAYELLRSGAIEALDVRREGAARASWETTPEAVAAFRARRTSGADDRVIRGDRGYRRPAPGERVIFADVDSETRNACSVSIDSAGRLVLEVVREGEHVTRTMLTNPDAARRLCKALEGALWRNP